MKLTLTKKTQLNLHLSTTRKISRFFLSVSIYTQKKIVLLIQWVKFSAKYLFLRHILYSIIFLETYTLGDPFNATSDTDLRLFVTSVTDGIYKCRKEEEVKVGNATIKIKNVFLIEFYNNSDISAPKGKLYLCYLCTICNRYYVLFY